MTIHSETATHLAGEYRVVHERNGQGIDRYLRVTGPDGRTSEQKVYWVYSMTAFQVAEAAVAGHVGHHGTLRHAAPTREAHEGGCIVTLA